MQKDIFGWIIVRTKEREQDLSKGKERQKMRRSNLDTRVANSKIKNDDWLMKREVLVVVHNIKSHDKENSFY